MIRVRQGWSKHIFEGSWASLFSAIRISDFGGDISRLTILYPHCLKKLALENSSKRQTHVCTNETSVLDLRDEIMEVSLSLILPSYLETKNFFHQCLVALSIFVFDFVYALNSPMNWKIYSNETVNNWEPASFDIFWFPLICVLALRTNLTLESTQ